MASRTASQALTKRSQDTALMPPPPQPKRIKRPRRVVDEDDYTDALSRIIARDFFPGLVETESQQDYLNALESGDREWIASTGRRLTEIMTPGPNGRSHRGRRGTSMTPMTELYGRGGETPKMWQGDTPMSVASTATEGAQASKKPEIDTNMSLGTFQSKYTSEDNESFYKLLDKQNTKKSEKHAWLWADNKIPAPRQIAHRKREAALLADNTSQAQFDGMALVKADSLDTRKAMPDSWRSRPDNNFMFEPSGIEDTHQTIQQRAEESSRAPPKAVVYDNTRLAASTSAPPEEIPPSPSLSAVQDAIAGRPRPSASEAAFNGASTPRVNGYAFVDPEPPSPPPGPASTWNSNDHSFLLGSGDATPNPFKIKEGSAREALHHRMVDRVAKGKRAVGRRENELSKTPVPRFASSPRVAKGGVTPAAQRLLGRIGGGKTPNIWEGKGGESVRRSGLRNAMTPVQKTAEG